MAQSFEVFLTHLAERHRVLMLGGLAVIAHGLSRPTKDADAWLEPMDSPETWSKALLSVMSVFPEAKLFALFERRVISGEELPAVIDQEHVVRVTGLTPDLDIFRIPNNLDPEQFDLMWKDGAVWGGGIRVLDVIDLLVTKEATGRDQDRLDITFLEGKVRSDFSARLRTCSPVEAENLLARYSDHVVAAAALENPDAAVQALGLGLLRDLAADGNPFARDLLQARETPSA